MIRPISSKFLLPALLLASLGYAYGPSPQNAAIALLFSMFALILIPYGIIQCFFGYRFFKLILGVIGFIVGSLLGVAISGGADVSSGVAILITLILGIGGAYASIALYFVGVFLIGASAGAALIAIISQGEAAPILYILGAVAIGVLALILQKVVIVVSTAWSGAFSIVLYLNFTNSSAPAGIILLLFLVLFIGGMFVQFRVSAKNLPDKVKDRLAGETQSQPALQ